MKDKEFLIKNGVNVEKSLELFGDMETYNDTLGEFMSSISEKKENLQRYKEISDMANYAIYAHSIKSDAKYFGFDKLAELALNHEMAAKQNNMYYVTEHYDEFIKEILNVEKIINQYTNMPVIEELDTEYNKDKEFILVVDDSAVINKFVTNIFHDKYQVLEAWNGSEAISYINSNKNIKKMLLDLNMPNFNGFDVLKYLSENNLFDSIKVVVITGIGEESILQQAKAYPVSGILLKPFNERDVKNILES